MALFEEGLIFADPRAPFLQFLRLQVDLGQGSTALLETYQDDDVWGLSLSEREVQWDSQDGVYRVVSPSLPTGLIESVAVTFDEYTLSELVLRVEHHELLFIAGEVREKANGDFDLVRFDESVLVFEDAALADGLEWRPPRRRT